MHKILGAFFILFPLVFISIGGFQAWQQHHAISTFQPVKAMVTKTDIAENRGSKSTSYTPVVYYTYQLGGKTFHNKRVLPIKISSGYTWASNIISLYPSGTTQTAYVDPDNPQDAFLYRKYSFFPYMFIMFPTLFIGIGIGIATGANNKKRYDHKTHGNEYELIPCMSNTHKLKVAIRANIPLWIIWAATVGHYFSVAQKPYPTLPVVVSCVYTAICVGAGVFVWYFHKLSKTLEPPRMSINNHPLVNGQDFRVNYKQRARENLMGQAVTLDLICWRSTLHHQGGKTRVRRDKVFEDKRQLKDMFSVRIFDEITATQDFSIPLSEPPTTPNPRGYPRIEWTLKLHVKLQGCPDYRCEYAILVNPLT